jgi:DNA helicase II / ATP-dependent DNA helicase PcrA
MNCPKCGAQMIIRNRKDGSGKFYGCTKFPACRGIVNYQGEVRRVTVEKTSDRVWSKYQLDLFDAAGRTESNILVNAKAGSGKTSSAIQMLNYTTRYKKVAFVAFGRDIAREFKSRVPHGTDASTFHSSGLKAVMAKYPEAKVEEFKDINILKSMIGKMGYTEGIIAESCSGEIRRLASLMKGMMLEPTAESITFLSDRFGIDTGIEEDQEIIYKYAVELFKASDSDKTQVGFDDMVYWCANGTVDPFRYDLLVVDEFQDMSPSRIAMAMNMVRDGGRIIAVGDEDQAIMGFSGADTESMDTFRKLANPVEMPLSITYRCPASHVRLAQELVPDIEARPNAPEGTIRHVGEYDWMKYVKDGTMVVCRTNAPLVKPCFDLLREGVKAIIVGKDVSKGLVGLVNRVEKKNRPGDAHALFQYMAEYGELQVKRFVDANKLQQAANLQDQIATVEAIGDGCRTVDEVRAKINGIFSDEETEGVRFMTGHKGKGLESDDVIVLRPDQLPHPMAKQDWEKKQEKCLEYVIKTRSKDTLTFVHGING